MPVLPFHLEYSDTEPPRPTFSAFTTAPLTVIINPKPYIALTRELRKKCQVELKYGSNGETYDAKMVACAGMTWDDFDRLRVDGAKGVLQALDRQWRGVNGVNSGLMCMGVLEAWVKQVGREAAKGRVLSCQETVPVSDAGIDERGVSGQAGADE